jgi:hypothetical protein
MSPLTDEVKHNLANALKTDLQSFLDDTLDDLSEKLRIDVSAAESEPGQPLAARVAGLPVGGILQQMLPLPIYLNLDGLGINLNLSQAVSLLLDKIKVDLGSAVTGLNLILPELKTDLTSKSLLFANADPNDRSSENFVEPKANPPVPKPGLPVVNLAKVPATRPGIGGVKFIDLAEAPPEAVSGVPGARGVGQGSFNAPLTGTITPGAVTGTLTPGALTGTVAGPLTGVLEGILDKCAITLPVDVPLTAEVKWSVRTGDQPGSQEVSKGDYRMTGELNATSVNVLLRPETYDWLESDLPVQSITRYLHAHVTLTAGDVKKEYDLPPARLQTISLGIPRLIALFENSNFEGACLIMVPEHSPLPDVSTFLEMLAPLGNILSVLGTFKQFAAFATGLGQLVSAVSVNPNIRFRVNEAKTEKIGDDEVTYEGVRNLNDITLIYKSRFSNDLEAEDEISSLILIGNPGACVQCFNDRDFEGGEGWFEVKTEENFCTLVRNLHFVKSEHRAVRVMKEPDGGLGETKTFGDEMSSICWATCS